MPDDAAFQKKVLIHLLTLFERTDGPFILKDFPWDAPESEDDEGVLSCPVNFDELNNNDPDPLKSKFIREIQAMRPWYDLALKKRGRTTAGGSGMEIDLLGEFLYGFIKGDIPENARDDVDIFVTLKLAVEDIKSFYVEGVTSQPGQQGLSSRKLSEWFWNDTIAGEVLLKLVKACSESDNEMIRMTGQYAIAPMDVVIKSGIVGDQK